MASMRRSSRPKAHDYRPAIAIAFAATFLLCFSVVARPVAHIPGEEPEGTFKPRATEGGKRLHVVRATSALETTPSVAGDAFAWSQSSRPGPDRFNAFTRSSGSTKRLNPADQAFVGSTDGSLVAYWVRRSNPRDPHDFAEYQEDIHIYDLATDRNIPLPEGTNTPSNEYRPTVSGEWLLYGRWTFDTRPKDYLKTTHEVILLNLATRDQKVLATSHRRDDNEPGQVNGDWAVWTDCTYGSCTVHRYHIPTGGEDVVQGSTYSSSYVHAASVTQDGIVYYVADGQCGQHPGIYRWDGTSVDQLVSWSTGYFRYIRSLFATRDSQGEINVYFGLEKVDATRRFCPLKKADLYRMTDDYAAEPSASPSASDTAQPTPSQSPSPVASPSPSPSPSCPLPICLLAEQTRGRLFD